jgi:DNA-binding response OmpR family regulator
LELYEKYGARVIVLDIMLPGMNGFSVCSRIRETSNIHILIEYETIAEIREFVAGEACDNDYLVEEIAGKEL